MIEWSFRLRLHVFQFLFCLRSLEKCKSKPLDRFSRAQSHEWNEWPQALCTSTQTTTTLNENGKATWNKTIFFFFFIGNRLRFIFESQRRHLNAQKWRIKQSEMFPYRFASCELIHFLLFCLTVENWAIEHFERNEIWLFFAWFSMGIDRFGYVSANPSSAINKSVFLVDLFILTNNETLILSRTFTDQ